MESVISYQEPKELKAECKELSEIVPQLVNSITDQKNFEMAANEVMKWNDFEKRWVAYWEKAKKAAHEVHKIITGMEKEMLVVVEQNRGPLKKAISDYLLEQRKREEEERNRLELIAVAKAEAERKKLLEQAAKAEAKGKSEMAETLFEQAQDVFVEPVILPSATPKKIELEGGGTQSAKEDFELAITNEKVFTRAALAHEQNFPWSAIVVSLSLPSAKSWIRSEGIKTFPGLEIIKKMSITTRKGK